MAHGRRKEHVESHIRVLWGKHGTHIQVFCLRFIGKKAVTWPNLTAREAGKCRLAVCL